MKKTLNEIVAELQAIVGQPVDIEYNGETYKAQPWPNSSEEEVSQAQAALDQIDKEKPTLKPADTLSAIYMSLSLEQRQPLWDAIIAQTLLDTITAERLRAAASMIGFDLSPYEVFEE